MIVALIYEVIGYIGRVASSSPGNRKLFPFVILSVYILIAPAFLAASIYMIFGEIIRVLGAEHYSVIRIERSTKYFVTSDVISLLLQAGGGGLSIVNQKWGRIIIIIGLAIQIIAFSLIIYTMIIFLIRIHNSPTKISLELDCSRPIWGNWKHAMYAMLAACILIMVRSIFRVAEFIEGADGVLQSKERYFFAFESSMIIVAVYFLLSINFLSFLSSVEEWFTSSFENIETHHFSNF